MSGKARKTDVGRRVEPELPDFYMPAMPPLGLQRNLCEWLRAWRQRRLYRQLLELDDRALAARDLNRQLLSEKARLPLRQLMAQRRSNLAAD
jgi:hypothetical protein